MDKQAKVKHICDVLGVSPEEALSSLEQNGWSLGLAMPACHQKHVPDIEFESLPRVSLNNKSTAEAGCSSKTPGEEEPSPEVKKERIDRFREVAPALYPQEAVDILKQFNWDVSRAVNHFMDRRDLQNMSDSDSDDKYEDEDETSAALAVEQGEIGLMDADEGDLLKKADEAIPPMALSQLQIQEEELLPPIKVDRVCNTVGVARQEALYYVDGFSGNLALAMEACRSKTLLPLLVKPSPGVSNEIQPEPVPLLIKKADLTDTFCNVTGASFDDAVYCLTRCNWICDDAIGYFMDKRSRSLNSQRIPEGGHSTIGQSSSQWPSEGGTGSSEDVASKGLSSDRQAEIIKSFCNVTAASPDDAVSCLNQCNWNEHLAISCFLDENIASEGVASKALDSETPLMDSQSHLQAPLGSSSSSMNTDPTETEESLREARGESVTTITPMQSSQVDTKLKDKAVEEDSSTETCLDMISVEITFPDETNVNIPFRPDQTVRDIRNAIDALRPDESRDYYLMSRTSEVYKDLSTTVAKISTRGSTSLMVLYSD